MDAQDLGFNPLGPTAAVALRDAAARSRTLERLSLAGVRVESGLVTAIHEALTPAGKAAPSASRLFENGLHTEFTHKAMLAERASRDASVTRSRPSDHVDVT